MKSHLAIVFALLPCSAWADRGLPKSTQSPTAERKGDQVRIEFSVDRETDVAVFVENADGEIVRHLVAGVLAKGQKRKPNSKHC